MFIPYWTLLLVFQVNYACIPLSPTSPNSTPAPTEAASEESETSETPNEGLNTTTANPTEETTKKPEAKDCLTVELNPGRPCVFPFTYQYHQHFQCLPFKDKFWCALTPIYNKDQWGYCDHSLCPPTAVQPTTTPTEEPAVTQESGAANTTTEVLESLVWESASTSVEINIYTCEISFDFALQEGIKYKQVSGACSSSSALNTEDRLDRLGIHTFSLKSATGIELRCEVGAALLEDSKSLSEEVLKSSLKCVAGEVDCVTVDGEVFPAKCVFPFNYKGRNYKACTDRPGTSKLFCPTELTENLEPLEGKWGFCGKRCSYCKGSPLKTRNPSKPCGFDCIMNDYSVKSPLISPTITVESLTGTTYTGETAGHYTFNTGEQNIKLTCQSPSKFHAKNLRDHKTVIAKCGPTRHHFDVFSEDDRLLEKEATNELFGCDPCPLMFYYVPGSLSRFSISVNAKSLMECGKICEYSKGCLSFYFSMKTQTCNLLDEQQGSVSYQTDDYIICSKIMTTDDSCGSYSMAEKKGYSGPLNKNTSIPFSHQRKPDTNTVEYYAEFYGRAIIRLFQLLGSNPAVTHPSNAFSPALAAIPPALATPKRPYPPLVWSEVKKDFGIANNSHDAFTNIPPTPGGTTHGIYMFFMGPAPTTLLPIMNTIMDFTIDYQSMFAGFRKSWSIHNDIIPFYLGKSNDLWTRYKQHNTAQGVICHWRKMMFDDADAGALTPSVTAGPQHLYHTFLVLRNDFDTLLIERFFLDHFNFIENSADNYQKRTLTTAPGATGPPYCFNCFFRPDYQRLIIWPAYVTDPRFDPLCKFKKYINERWLFNVNRFFPILYNKMPFLHAVPPAAAPAYDSTQQMP